MQTLKIHKRNGTYRIVVAPSPEEKAKLRFYIPILQKVADARCPTHVVHGFWPDRSPVTNAAYHCGYMYTVGFDLRNFFDTVTSDILDDVPMDYTIRSAIFIDGIARQGLPTSPVVANIAAAKMDHELENFSLHRRISYTRYADDLTFSMQDSALIEEVKQFVSSTVGKHRFALNDAKTHVQSAKAGRRMITGVAVDHDIHPSRASKRRLRAALHNGHRLSALGLAEWIKLKYPSTYINDEERSRTRFADIIDFDEGKKP